MKGSEANKEESLLELLQRLEKAEISGAKRYFLVQSHLDARARERGIPLQGSFELTPLCNLSCKMCYVRLSKEQMGEKRLLRVNDWKYLMEEAIQEGMLYARLTGGECLAYPGFKNVYEFLGDHGVEVSVLTNGVLLDQEMTEYFVERPPALIQITLYGASEEAYEQVTGQRCFSRVRDNIIRAQKAGLPVSVVLTPNGFTTDGEEQIRFCKSLNMKPIINLGLVMPRSETGRVLWNVELDHYISMLRLQQKLFPDSSENGAGSWEELLSPRADSAFSEGAPKQGVLCAAGRSCFHIAWDGQMEPCSAFPGIREDALDLGIHEAWERIHKQITAFPYPQECRTCKEYNVCATCVAEHAAGAPLGHVCTDVCDRVRRMAMEKLI